MNYKTQGWMTLEIVAREIGYYDGKGRVSRRAINWTLVHLATSKVPFSVWCEQLVWRKEEVDAMVAAIKEKRHQEGSNHYDDQAKTEVEKLTRL